MRSSGLHLRSYRACVRLVVCCALLSIALAAPVRAVPVVAQNTQDEAVGRIRAALQAGELARAREAAGAALERHPEGLDVLTWAGHAYRLGEDLATAGRLYRRALELDPDAPEALMGLASVLEAVGNDSGAIATYRRVVELAPEVAAPRRPLGTLLMRGGHYPEAAGHLQAWTEAFPDDHEAIYLLGMAHYLGGDADAATPVFEALLAARPDYVPATYALGVVLADRPEQRERARVLLETALEAGWETANAAYLLGRVRAESGDDAGALVALERAVAEDPGLVDAHYQLALTLGRLGESDRARATMERFRILQQDFNRREAADKELKALRNELASRLAAGDADGALETVDRMLAAFPGRADVLVLAAKVWISNGETAAALDAAVAARQTEPANWEALYLEGLLLSDAGREGEALQRLRSSIERNPLFPDAHAVLGNVLLERGQAAAAVEAYLAAIDLDTDNPGYWLNLATAYAAIGRGDLQADALDTYRRLSTREDPPS